MKKRQPLNNKDQRPEQAKFSTDNPRHLRAIHALDTRPMPREHLDSAAGCSNSPELVAELRRRGLEIPCTRVTCLDRDGRECRPGIYHLTDKDRRILAKWLRNSDLPFVRIVSVLIPK